MSSIFFPFSRYDGQNASPNPTIRSPSSNTQCTKKPFLELEDFKTCKLGENSALKNFTEYNISITYDMVYLPTVTG